MENKNIFVLPTDKPSRLYLEDKVFKLSEYDEPNVDYAQNQNIYITNDEEIKEGDWYYDLNLNKIKKALEVESDRIYYTRYHCTIPINAKKIILTTDAKLIADGVQEISEEFLQWYVNNSSCEEVMVDKFISGKYFCTNPIIPSEKPLLDKAGEKFLESADMTILIERPNQETIEEVAERLYPTTIDSFTDTGIDMSETERLIFINGAKWQQENILQLLKDNDYQDEPVFELLTEQFKNK